MAEHAEKQHCHNNNNEKKKKKKKSTMLSFLEYRHNHTAVVWSGRDKAPATSATSSTSRGARIHTNKLPGAASLQRMAAETCIKSLSSELMYAFCYSKLSTEEFELVSKSFSSQHRV